MEEATAVAATSLWAFVTPWITILRANADVSFTIDRNGASVVRVHLITRKCDENSPWEARVEECWEAMELLAMIQVVNFAAWSELMTLGLGCKNTPLRGAGGRGGDPSSPRYSLTFYRDREGEVRVRDLDRFAHFFWLSSSEARERTSDELKHARQEIVDQCTPDMLRRLRAYRHFPVDVTFNPPLGQTNVFNESYLEDVQVVTHIFADCAIEAQQARNDSGASALQADLVRDGIPFDPRYVKLDLSEMSLPPGEDSLYFVAEIAARGVCLEPGIDLDHEKGLGSLSAMELGPILLAMTDHSRFNEGCEPLERLPTCETKLRCGSVGYRDAYVQDEDPRYSDPDIYKCEAICSALFTSQDVDHVHLKQFFSNGSRSEKWRKWQWLAFALFSNESTSTVSTLTIEDYDFEPENMAAIVSILGATNPAMKMLSKKITGPYYHYDYSEDRYHQGESDNMADEELGNAGSICVPAGTVVNINPSHSSSEKWGLLNLATDSTFRVIKKDDASSQVVDCLVPGYGHCSVARESVSRFEPIAVQEEVPTALLQGYNGNMRKLQLCFEFPTDFAVMVPLIEYLGPKLEMLDLQGRIYLRRATLRIVLAACPNLKKLLLANAETGVEIDILNAFEQNNCGLSEFAILQMVPSEETITLAHAFQDPKSVISSRLQGLALVAKHGSNLDEATLSAFLEVLKVNKTLETLLLVTHSSKPLQEEFKKFNHEVLPTSIPLPTIAQLAFLSVLKRLRAAESDDQKDLSPSKRRRVHFGIDLERLDQGVLSLVFEFAADRKVRSVNLRS